MRYYNTIFKTTSEEIGEKADISLREYGYGNNIMALNNYMDQTLRNSVSFFAFREEDDRLYATFAFDERMESKEKVYKHILDILQDVFQITETKIEPYEITTLECLENRREAGRRDYEHLGFNFLKRLGLEAFNAEEFKTTRYAYDERIVSACKINHESIYDLSFQRELQNIKEHKMEAGYSGNMVHYVISERSMEAGIEMAEILTENLYAANRIVSERLTIISEIDCDFKIGSGVLRGVDELIEHNYGGVVAFDLTEKLGCSPTEYSLVVEHLLKLLKRYRNQCLFIFLYNMDHPGFSYYILPKLQKYVVPVMLREGSGNRNEAVEYLRDLVMESEDAEYACYVEEFMQQCPGDTFTQTDVMESLERFGSWCINKKLDGAYSNNPMDEFFLDRDENAKSCYDKLQDMIGLSIVKDRIDEIIAADIVEKERKNRKGKDYETSTMHMIFSGNPGTAKTTVARLFAGIAKEKSILKSGIFVERNGVDCGGLAGPAIIRDSFKAAKGGVLFIDEAYEISGGSCVTELLNQMESHRDDVILILAGYEDSMKYFIEQNEGLRSRIPYWIDFPDYSEEELTEIFKMMLAQKGFSATKEAIEDARLIFEKKRYARNFGNGRYVRNLLENAMRKQSVRLLKAKGDAADIRKKELFLITKQDISELEDGLKDERVPGTAQKELNAMIGLSSVKEVIHKALANYKIRKLCMENGITKDRASLHMVFTGNPGTAKTTVARLVAEIVKDEKIMPTGNIIEVGRADLIGGAVGQTALKVKQRFNEARGGILFIDEAYALCDGYNGYGDEAINTIVQELENHREDVIVIFAGYPKPMQEFLDRNPGMSSRIAFHVNFEDYTVDELCEITKLMVEKKSMQITDEAMEKLKCNFEKVVGTKDYGNGRYVRKMLEEAEMNLAERLCVLQSSGITKEVLTTLEAYDIPEEKAETKEEKVTLGFAV